MTSRSKWCDICGGNLINGSCPEHRTPSLPLEKKGVDTLHNDTSTLDEVELSPSRLGGVGRLLTKREIELLNNPFGR
jgi:hypothetical protein